MSRDLRAFSSDLKNNFGRNCLIFSWFLVQNIIFKNYYTPSWFRARLLRFWGASIGKNVILRRGLKIHFPWNLTIGDNSWIGEEVWIINHEKVFIGANVCVSQRAIICSSGHDYRSRSLQYSHKPIHISDGAWICLDAKILPGVRIGTCSVVSAGEIARDSLSDFTILISGQIHHIQRPI